MSETLTVDPTPDVGQVGEVEGVALSADEQDSQAVGEQMIAQQEQLLAGKYKDAESLEKAYIELQKKLGQDGKEEKEIPDAESQSETEEVLQTESEEDSPNFSPTAEVILSASEEFEDSGKLSQETLDKFGQMSSQDLVKAYMEVQQEQQAAQQAQMDMQNKQLDVQALKAPIADPSKNPALSAGLEQ